VTKRKTLEEFKRQCLVKHPNILVLGTQYINNKTKILVKCSLDSHSWESRPNDLLSGYGCPKCANNVKKTLKQINEEVNNKGIDITLYRYEGAHIKVPYTCNKCKTNGSIVPHSILSHGFTCTTCKPSQDILYIAKDTDNELIKIGITYSTSTLKSRINNISKSMVLLKAYITKGTALVIEKECHTKLEKYRVRNYNVNNDITEFFDIEENSLMLEINNILYNLQEIIYD